MDGKTVKVKSIESFHNKEIIIDIWKRTGGRKG